MTRLTDGLPMVAEAIGAAESGEQVDVAPLRAVLTHQADQLQAMGGEDCERMATFLERLQGAVDELEAGRIEQAWGALREALCSTFGR